MTTNPTIKHWQQINHEVGMLEFMDSEEASRSFPHSIPKSLIPIGLMEAELLCIDNSTDEILLMEHEVANHVCCSCAASQQHFIAAVRIIEAHFANCIERDGLADDTETGLAVIKRAVEAAGGPKYEPLYHSLVGY